MTNFPDPVLGLLAFTGLIVYLTVGATLSSLAIKYGSRGSTSESNSYPFFKVFASVDNTWFGEAWTTLGLMTVFWPALLALGIGLVVTAGVLFIVLALPVLIVQNIAKYIAIGELERAREKKKEVKF